MRWLKKRRLRKLTADIERRERLAEAQKRGEQALAAIVKMGVALGMPEDQVDAYYARALDKDIPPFVGGCKTQVELLLEARDLYDADQPKGSASTDRMQLGHHAKRLLDDPIMKLAIEHVTVDLMKTWRETACEDTEKREDAYRMLRALDGVEFKLKRFANNAALIAAEQRRKEEAQSRS